MTDLPVVKCCICGKDTTIVCSSAFGPISSAYCEECLSKGIEQWDILIGGLYGCRPGKLNDHAQETLERTCKYYNKTEKEFWDAVQKLENDYEEYCRKQQEK